MTIATSPTNASACEICGTAPADQYVRNQVARDGHLRYVRTRSNRTRIETRLWEYDFYTARLAGFPRQRWAGKLACHACRAKLVAALNA